MIANYSEIVLVTDKYESEGARKGMIGYVIETVTEENIRLSAEPGTSSG